MFRQNDTGLRMRINMTENLCACRFCDKYREAVDSLTTNGNSLSAEQRVVIRGMVEEAWGNYLRTLHPKGPLCEICNHEIKGHFVNMCLSCYGQCRSHE